MMKSNGFLLGLDYFPEFFLKSLEYLIGIIHKHWCAPPPRIVFVIGASGDDQLWNGNVGLLVCILFFPSLPEKLCFLEELSPSSRPYSGPAQISSRWERKPHELLRSSISRSKPGQHIKKRKLHFADKGPCSQSYGFSSSQCMDVRVWLYRRLKNRCFQTVVLEKTLERTAGRSN